MSGAASCRSPWAVRSRSIIASVLLMTSTPRQSEVGNKWSCPVCKGEAILDEQWYEAYCKGMTEGV